jgi:hypothetical protein
MKVTKRQAGVIVPQLARLGLCKALQATFELFIVAPVAAVARHPRGPAWRFRVKEAR